jgi:hypothetical protein
MEGDSMKQFMGCLLLLCFVCCTSGIGIAQDPTMPPPKVLVIVREFLKPGKAGSPHLKTESAFVNAFAAAKWPQHYFAVDSLSGMPRSLFLVGYDSFASWEKDNAATQKNAALSAALDKASIADGEMLSSYESSTFVFREDLSFQAPVNIAQMRYFEISRFHVKPGHGKEFEALAKMYQDGYKKAVPDAHWAVFEDMYGMDSGGSFVVFVPMKSLEEVDKGFGDSKKFSDAMGDEGMKKLSDLTASAVDQAASNLFVFNPKLSYPPDEWVKADPEFWKQKATAPAKPPAKPAQ